MSQRCCPAVVAAFSGGPTYRLHSSDMYLFNSICKCAGSGFRKCGRVRDKCHQGTFYEERKYRALQKWRHCGDCKVREKRLQGSFYEGGKYRALRKWRNYGDCRVRDKSLQGTFYEAGKYRALQEMRFLAYCKVAVPLGRAASR
jgi:hypothetical protein